MSSIDLRVDRTKGSHRSPQASKQKSTSTDEGYLRGETSISDSSSGNSTQYSSNDVAHGEAAMKTCDEQSFNRSSLNPKAVSFVPSFVTGELSLWNDHPAMSGQVESSDGYVPVRRAQTEPIARLNAGQVPLLDAPGRISGLYDYKCEADYEHPSAEPSLSQKPLQGHSARSISLSRYPASESHKPATMSRITNLSPSKPYVSRYHDQSYTPQSSARPMSPQSLGEISTLHHTQWTSAPSPTNDVSAQVNSCLYQTNSVFTAPMVPVPELSSILASMQYPTAQAAPLLGVPSRGNNFTMLNGGNLPPANSQRPGLPTCSDIYSASSLRSSNRYYDDEILLPKHEREDQVFITQSEKSFDKENGDLLVGKASNVIPAPHKPLGPPRFPKRKISPKPNQDQIIKIYGTRPAMHYDLKTNLYHGDGSPRRTFHRSDGTFPRGLNHNRIAEPDPTSVDTRRLPLDTLHLQPALEVQNSLVQFGVDKGLQSSRYCRCENIWKDEEDMESHKCNESEVKGRVQAGPVTRRQVDSENWVPARCVSPNQNWWNDHLTDEEIALQATNGAYIATGAGDGDHSGTIVRDFAELCLDDQGVKRFMGAIVRDFAQKGGRKAKVLHLE